MVVADARVDAAFEVVFDVVAASAGLVLPGVIVTILVVVAVCTAVTVFVTVRVVVARTAADVMVTVRVACTLTVFCAVTVATTTLGWKSFDRDRRMGCCLSCRFCLPTCTLSIGFARPLRRGEPSSSDANGLGLAKLAQMDRKEKSSEYFMSVVVLRLEGTGGYCRAV